MSEKWIDQLTICNIGVDRQVILPILKEETTILARGKSTVEWVKAHGLGQSILWQLDDRDCGADATFAFDGLVDSLRSEGCTRLLYITSVAPLSVDLLAAQLRRHSRIVTEIPHPSPNFPDSLSGDFEQDGAIQYLDALKIHADLFPVFSTSMPVYLHLAGVNIIKTRIIESLRQVYPTDHKLLALVEPLSNQWQPVSLNQLHEAGEELAAVYIPMLSADSSLESFMQVIARLRAPGGCPWDRKQTHTSLRPYMLEEAYEALEALDNGSIAGLREELGDILLQIALHTQIAVENGEFTIADVLQSINRKIVSRHPHVFGDVNVRDDRDVVQNWEKLKELERAENGNDQHKGLLDGIPAILPSLSQAQSIQARAARVGFDWPEIKPVIEKVMEEMQEVSEAEGAIEREHELGDLLFAVVNLVRWYKVDAESALRYTNLKFRKRFAYLESRAKSSGRELQKMTLEEMDALWEDAKAFDDLPKHEN